MQVSSFSGLWVSSNFATFHKIELAKHIQGHVLPSGCKNCVPINPNLYTHFKISFQIQDEMTRLVKKKFPILRKLQKQKNKPSIAICKKVSIYLDFKAVK